MSEEHQASECNNPVWADLARDALAELKAKRRWKIIFRFIFIGLAVLYLAVMTQIGQKNKVKTVHEPHVALIHISGVIGAQEQSNARDINEVLKNAFSNDQTQAVVLNINSPGGSPVQSGQIYREIMRLKKENKIPVYAFIEDMGASGAYYIAAAADQIYADPASIVGSIGVISGGVGVGDLLKKLGLESRIFTAGAHKAFLNPAEPLKKEELAHMQTLLDDLHQQFIAAVKEGRGERINAEKNPELFSGLFWSGTQALPLGLVDSLDDFSQVLARDFKDIAVIDYTPEKSPWEAFLRQTASQGKILLRELGGVGEQIHAVISK